MRLKVGLLGGGSWGTTVAATVSRNAPITLWARDAETVDGINRDQENRKYLPGIRLPAALRATADLGEAVAGADVLVMGVPSHSFRAVLEEARDHLRPWVPVISLTKGLELATGKRMTEVIEEVLPGHPVGVLTGPNLAREIMSGQAAASVLSKVTAVLPEGLRDYLAAPPFFVSGHGAPVPPVADLSAIRAAIRDERKLAIAYADEKGNRTERTVWPIAVAYYVEATLLGAWCELRNDFRHFRMDRILSLAVLDERFPVSGRTLMGQWLALWQKPGAT